MNDNIYDLVCISFFVFHGTQIFKPDFFSGGTIYCISNWKMVNEGCNNSGRLKNSFNCSTFFIHERGKKINVNVARKSVSECLTNSQD